MNDRLWIVVVLAVVGGASVEAHTERRFIAGLAVAIAAGVLSSLLSDAIAFSSSVFGCRLEGWHKSGVGLEYCSGTFDQWRCAGKCYLLHVQAAEQQNRITLFCGVGC